MSLCLCHRSVQSVCIYISTHTQPQCICVCVSGPRPTPAESVIFLIRCKSWTGRVKLLFKLFVSPTACLANKVGILQLPSERSTYLFQRTEL
uniref:Uncharacterized protein n=1 Tax=Echeneis naucrates TaxID=173247 RepID=A0A665TCC6_ECHNA